MQFTALARQGYLNLWNKAIIDPGRKAELRVLGERFIAHRARYEVIQAQTGVPWWWIALAHERESDGDFDTYLGNGDRVIGAAAVQAGQKTTHVPRGRGPWATWEDGAVDALRYMGLDKIKDWSLPHALYQFERYNGFGYTSHAVNSPYVWSWTNLYTRGKFTSDGNWNGSFRDPQPGCAAMLKELIELIPDLLGKAASDMTDTVPTPPVTAPVPSAGITISTATNLATHVLFGVGAVLGAFGLSSVHSIYDIVTSQGLFGGLIVSALAAGISHLNVVGANDNTLQYADKILSWALSQLPQQQSLAQQVSAPSAPEA